MISASGILESVIGTLIVLAILLPTLAYFGKKWWEKKTLGLFS
jgi:hypothetical protein